MKLTRPILSIALAVVAGLLATTHASKGTSVGSAPILPTRKVVGGILVLEHDPQSFDRATALAIDPTALTTIASEKLESPYDLTYVTSGSILSDGRVAAWAMVGARLLFFGADGEPLHAFGGEGKGPKEITSARNAVLLSRDTLLLLDGGNSRVVWAVADAGIVRTIFWESDAAARGRAWTPDYKSPLGIAAGALRDGRILSYYGGAVSGIPKGAEPGKIFRQSAPLMVLDVKALKATKLADLADIEVMVRERRENGKTYMNTDFVGLSRRAHAVVWDSVIVTAEGKGYVLDLRDPRGKVMSRLQSARPRAKVTGAMRSRYVSHILDRYGDMAVDREEHKKNIRTMPFADSLPPYEHIFVSNDKLLWVVDGMALGDTAWTATAFRQDGAMVARLRVANTSTPLAFAKDRVLLWHEDADGNVSLTVHRIVEK